MKKILLIAVCQFLVVLTSLGQSPVSTVPQSQQATIFNAVSTAQTSGCLQNQGQNIWFSNYLITGGTPTAIQYRLEYSYNSDAATCTTGTWFAMSDDGSELIQAEVVGIGAYPFVRANLVQCIGCSSSITLSSFYSTSSSSPSTLNGFYNPSQQNRKILFTRVAGNLNTTASGVPAPYGSTYGFIIFNTTSTLLSSCSIQVVSHLNQLTAITSTFNLTSTPGGFSIAIPVPATPATSVDVTYNGATCGVSATRLITAVYIFYPPGSYPSSLQPASLSQGPLNNPNSEVTSTTNNPVTSSLEVQTGRTTLERGHLFSVSAYCSAGTAQLTVKDGGTTNSLNNGGVQIWSSAPADVGTTSFKFQWNPGLSSSAGNGILVTLGACGAGNTGTLDIQGSVTP